MKRYIIQDSERWLSGFVYDTIEQAREKIEFFKTEEYWVNAEYFIILELDTKWKTIREVEYVSNEKEDEK